MISHGKDLKIFSGSSNRALAEAICQDTLVRSAAWPAVPLPDAYWHITGSAAELDVFYLDGRPVSQWGDQYTYLSEELMDRLEALA